MGPQGRGRRARVDAPLPSSPGCARPGARTGELGDAEADAVEAPALLPADDPIIRPTAVSALRFHVHIEQGALAEAVALVRDDWPTGELPMSLSISQALASRGRLALRTGIRACAERSRGGRPAALGLAYVNPMALMWRSYAALASRASGARPSASSSRRSSGSRDGSRARADRRGAPRARCSPGGEMAERAREAVDVLAGSELRLAHARALIDLGAAPGAAATAATPASRCARGSTSPTAAAR